MHAPIADHMVVSQAGRYLINGQLAWNNTDTDGIRALRIEVNGESVARVEEPGTAVNTQNASTILRLNAGDVVRLVGFQNSGSSLGVGSPTEGFAILAVQWMGS
jgi:hypothetical protein